MFNITQGKGFHMTFANGCTISVQWGHGNYCENKYVGSYGQPAGECPTAEVAAWDSDGNYIRLDDCDDVIGWQTPEQVAVLIAKICTYQPEQKLIEAQK